MSTIAHTIDTNFKKGGSIGVIEQLDLITKWPQTVAILDGSGNQITTFGGGTQYTEDAAAPANPVGNTPILVRKDTPSATVTTDGDNIAQRGTDYGAAYVTLLDAGGAAVAIGGGTQYTEGGTPPASPIGTTLIFEDTGVWKAVSATQPLPVLASIDTTGLATSAKQDTGNTSLSSIDTKVPALGQALAASSVPVVLTAAQLTTLTPPAAITGFATSANQTTIIGHVDGIETLLSTIAGDTTSIQAALETVGGLVVNLGANNDVTVTSGTIDLGATDNAVLDTIDAVLDTIKTDTASIVTATQLIDNAISGAGFNITQLGGAAVPIGAGLEATALRVTIATDSTGVVSIDDGGGIITVDGAVTVSGTITEASGATIATNTGNAATSLAILDDWDNAASDGASVSGDVAHDSADAGEPIKIGMKAYSPDGTTPGTAVAEGDRSNAKSDLDGRLFVNSRSPRQLHAHLDGTAAYTDQALIADPGDGFQIVITSIIFASGEAVAINFFLEEGATKIFGPIYIEAVAGRGFVSGPIYLPVTASTAVTLTTSAANDQSFDCDYFIQAV